MKKKLCYTCKKKKSIEDFNRNKARTDGYNSICRSCSNDRSRKYYAENREKHKRVARARTVATIEKNRVLALEYLLSNSCPCGESDPVVLEFDHLRDKEQSVGQMVLHACSTTKVEEEIGKCQVLCANCHRRKTAKDGNWFKSVLS